MMGLARRAGLVIGLWALLAAGAASAQENLDKGKSGAQLYGSDCAFCHKSPQRLDIGRAGGLFGVDAFLREHYTVSRASAAAIAAYLKSVQQAGAAAPARSRARKQTARSGPDGEGGKGGAHGTPAAPKSADNTPADKKPKTTASAKPKKPE